MCAAMPALLLAHPLFTENDTGAGEAVCGAVSGLEWSASGAVNAEGGRLLELGGWRLAWPAPGSHEWARCAVTTGGRATIASKQGIAFPLAPPRPATGRRQPPAPA